MEILNYIDTTIHSYLMMIRQQHLEFVLEDCISRVVDEIKRQFRLSRGLTRRGDALSCQDVKELTMTVSHFMPQIQERARKAQEKYNKEQTLWRIRGTMANELIKKAFHEIGMTASVECQRYRAKVFVNLERGCLRFYVKYKDLEKENRLPEITQAVLDMNDAIMRIGGDVRLGF